MPWAAPRWVFRYGRYPEDRATYYRTRPCLIVELLSRATQRIDRREKLLACTAIESF